MYIYIIESDDKIKSFSENMKRFHMVEMEINLKNVVEKDITGISLCPHKKFYMATCKSRQEVVSSNHEVNNFYTSTKKVISQ